MLIHNNRRYETMKKKVKIRKDVSFEVMNQLIQKCLQGKTVVTTKTFNNLRYFRMMLFSGQVIVSSCLAAWIKARRMLYSICLETFIVAYELKLLWAEETRTDNNAIYNHTSDPIYEWLPHIWRFCLKQP